MNQYKYCYFFQCVLSKWSSVPDLEVWPQRYAVVGLIHVKDLLLLDIDHEALWVAHPCATQLDKCRQSRQVALKALLPLIGRPVCCQVLPCCKSPLCIKPLGPGWWSSALGAGCLGGFQLLMAEWLGTQVFIVDDDRPLLELLDEFRKGASRSPCTT